MEPNKYTDNFKKVIKAKLTEIASEDPLFAKNFAKPNKNIDDCINYILSTVQKSKIQGFTDDEVFGMAMHYYDEDDIKKTAPIKCQVIVNHNVPLTDEEISQLKEDAKKQVFEEHKKKLTTKPTSNKREVVTQATLF